MVYRATSESTGQTREERNAEARRVVVEMGLERHIDEMTEKEQEFVGRLSDAMQSLGDVDVSIKQLWWLRDLKDKYI